MIIESRLGVVSISRHAKKRFKQRFNLNKKCMYNVIKRVLNRGVTLGRYHIHHNMCLVIEHSCNDDRKFKIVTVINLDNMYNDYEREFYELS